MNKSRESVDIYLPCPLLDFGMVRWHKIRKQAQPAFQGKEIISYHRGKLSHHLAIPLLYKLCLPIEVKSICVFPCQYMCSKDHLCQENCDYAFLHDGGETGE